MIIRLLTGCGCSRDMIVAESTPPREWKMMMAFTTPVWQQEDQTTLYKTSYRTFRLYDFRTGSTGTEKIATYREVP